jgi:hypothetical protein
MRNPEPGGRSRGRCRFCRCTHSTPCGGGCAWVDRTQTLCTSCIRISNAWNLLQVARHPNMVHAFFVGFCNATGDPRAELRTRDGKPVNPYGTSGPTWKYWEHGFAAAEAAPDISRRKFSPRHP